MKAIKAFLIILLLLAIVFVVFSFILPTNYSISRKVHINTNPTHISAYVQNLNQWPHWSPWKDNDPSLEIKLGEQTTGVGATQSWVGDSSNGRLEITAVNSNGIEYVCYFDDDAQSCNSSFTYVEANGGTEVTWIMSGENTTFILGPYIVLLMENLLGSQFEIGLQKLKFAVEGKPPEKATDSETAPDTDKVESEEKDEAANESVEPVPVTETETEIPAQAPAEEAGGKSVRPVKAQATKDIGVKGAK